MSEFTFQQLMDNLQKIGTGVGILSNSTVEAGGFLAMVRTEGGIS